MRRLIFAAALAACSVSVGTGLALAQEGVPGTGSIANEGHAEGPGGEHVKCTAESTPSECHEFWEDHINWWSWDYKAGTDQAPEHRHMPPPFGFALINFFIFAGILYKLAAQPLKDFVRTRHTTIRKDLDEAAKLNAEAAARLREYDAKISGLDDEIQSLLKQVRSEAETEKSRIIAAAEEQARRLQADAEAQIAREVAEVRRALKAEASLAAVALAEQLISQKATESDQVRLTERFVADLERPAAAPAVAAPVRS